MDLKFWSFSGWLFVCMLCMSAEPAQVFREKTRELMPGAARFRERGGQSWEILDDSGGKIGALHQERISDSERQSGFGGTVEVALVTGTDGKIVGALVGKNQETPGFLRRVVASGFLKRWNGMTVKQAAEVDVDAVTGATYSSNAISHGVKTLANSLSATGTRRTLPKVDAEALFAEAARLEKRISLSSYILSRSTILMDQWQNRRTEELQLREVLALQGREAAEKFAEERNMVISGHSFSPPHGDTPTARALAAYRASGTERDLQTLRSEIARELDARFAALLPHNVEHAKSILAARKRLDVIRGKRGRTRPEEQSPDRKRKSR